MTTLYRIYGPTPQRLMYVGITDSYDKRMRQHSEKGWWSDVNRIMREEFDDRETAATAELAAIANERPMHNRAGKTERSSPREIPKAKAYVAPDPWLNQIEAAEYLGVTTRTIRNYIARGLLPASRIRGSRQIRIRLSHLDALLNPIPSAAV